MSERVLSARGEAMTDVVRAAKAWAKWERSGENAQAARDCLLAAVDALAVLETAAAEEKAEKLRRKKLARAALLSCTHCGDTRRMVVGEREVPCTRCPVPCATCRSGVGVPGRPLGPYCAKAPCDCPCHPERSRALAAIMKQPCECCGEPWDDESEERHGQPLCGDCTITHDEGSFACGCLPRTGPWAADAVASRA